MSLRRLVPFVLAAILPAVLAAGPGLCDGKAVGKRPASARAPRPARPEAAELCLGDWNGALEVSGLRLRIVVHFTRRADGSLSGTLDSPDQGASGLAMDTVVVLGDTLRFELKAVGGSYLGVLAPDGAAIRGTWRQAAVLPLDFVRGPGPEQRRPQNPVQPYPYDEDTVVVENRAAGVRLAGTLTRPRGSGPFAAVILVSGSGPQNRDEELLGHRPFLVLSDHLTRAGLAVLRLDDRGVGKSTGDFATATTADFASDARAAFEYLKARPDVDPARIGLIGHSEGGLVAPMVAAEAKDVAFVVLLAGPGLPGDENLYLQGEAVLRLMGEQDDVVLWNRGFQQRMFAEVKAAGDTASLRQRLLKVVAVVSQQVPESRRRQINAENLASQVDMMTTPWFRFFVAYDPAPALRQLACPVLALTGEKDAQVPPKENLAAIAKALAEGGNQDFRTLELPGLNHLFQTSRTGSPAEYGTIAETFAPAALDTITTWIEARVGRKAGGR